MQQCLFSPTLFPHSNLFLSTHFQSSLLALYYKCPLSLWDKWDDNGMIYQRVNLELRNTTCLIKEWCTFLLMVGCAASLCSRKSFLQLRVPLDQSAIKVQITQNCHWKIMICGKDWVAGLSQSNVHGPTSWYSMFPQSCQSTWKCFQDKLPPRESLLAGWTKTWFLSRGTWLPSPHHFTSCF